MIRKTFPLAISFLVFIQIAYADPIGIGPFAPNKANKIKVSNFSTFFDPASPFVVQSALEQLAASYPIVKPEKHLRVDGSNDMEATVSFDADETSDVGDLTNYVRDVYLGRYLNSDDHNFIIGEYDGNVDAMDVYLYSDVAGKYLYFSGYTGTPKLFIGTDVGIGTTSPRELLDVRGDGLYGDDSPFLHWWDTDSNKGKGLHYNSTGDYPGFTLWDTDYSGSDYALDDLFPLLQITEDENNWRFNPRGDTLFLDVVNNRVGIGTVSPQTVLDVQGAVTVGVDDTGYDVKFYGATAGSYLKWDGTEGTLELVGEATVWDDLVMPFTYARVPAANAPTWASFIGNLNAYTFAVDDIVEGTTELLHGWKEGSTVSWHIHWATNGQEGSEKAAKWQIEYTFADMDNTGVGDAFGSTTTDSTQTIIPTNTPDLTHMYTVMETTALTNTEIGAQIQWQVSRIDVVAATEPAANPFGLAVGIHIEKDTIGSNTIETK